MNEHKWTPAVTSSGRPCMFRSEVNEVVAALEADNKEKDRLLLAAAIKYTGLEAKLSKMEGALDLIAEDALWHDGHDNPEALEDIRKTVKSLGYTQEALAGGDDERQTE